MKFLISIILNCKNGEKYLDETLKSIKNQKYKNWELIFFDNNSTDKSYKIYKKNYEKRFRYFKSLKNLSLYEARNLALKKCKGNIIAFIDADDWWAKNYLSSRESFFKNKKQGFSYSKVSLFNQKTKSTKLNMKGNLPSGKIYSQLAKKYFIVISALMVKKKIFNQEGCFNKKFNILGDYEFVMKISKNNFAHSVSKALVYYRVHENNYSKIHKKEHYHEYQTWFNQQNKKDKLFKKNQINFEEMLNFIKLNYLVSEEFNLNLFLKIFKLQNLKSKINLLIKFFIPKVILNKLK